MPLRPERSPDWWNGCPWLLGCPCEWPSDPTGDRHHRDLPASPQCLPDSSLLTDGRLFHSMTLLQAGWAIVVGGRLSPVSSALEACCLRTLEVDCSSAPQSRLVVELTRLPPAEDLALPRWRHTATEVAHQGKSGPFAIWVEG